MDHDNTLIDRWRELSQSGDGISRGLIIENQPCPFNDDARWIPSHLQAWEPLVHSNVPEKFSALVLRDLDASRFSDTGAKSTSPSLSLHLLRAATTAVRRGVPILVHTPQRFASLKKPASTTVSPFNLDVTRLLAFEELVYLLQVHCELPLPSIDPSATVLYLTPIERRLAEALTAAGIPFKIQVNLAEFVVDFLIDEKLIVECDGEAWHDPKNDEERDVRLRGLGYNVVRFTGRAIHRNINDCISLIQTARKSPETRQFIPSIRMTDAQKRAASHLDGPAMVVAPAGSGKTRVIEERVRLLVAAGVEQSRICVLSFTNAAVGEVKDRLEDFPEVSTRTLSSFANEVSVQAYGRKTIIENHRNPRLPTPLFIIQEAARTAGYKPAVREGMWTTLRDAVMTYRGSFDIPSDDELGIRLEERNGETPQALLTRQREMFLRIHDAYDNILRRKDLQDFNGQVIDAIRVLSNDPQTRLMISESFDYWLIDEFQDLALPKIILARLLASPSRNLMVVGDDDQIIYGYAGAQPQSFSVLDRDWCDVTALPLDKNFRSPHELVVRTRWLIENNRDRIPKDTKPERAIETDNCVFIGLRENQNYSQAAVDEYLKLRQTRPAADFVFLFRTSMAAAPVELLLTEKGVKFESLAKQSLMNNRTSIWVFSWLKVINDRNASSQDWMVALRRPTRYFTNATLEWICSADDPYKRIQECITTRCQNVQGATEKQLKNLSQLVDQFVSIERTIDAARRFPDSLENQLRQLQLDTVLSSEEQREKEDAQKANAPVQGDGKSVDPRIVYQIVSLMATLAGTWNSLNSFLQRSETDRDINLDIVDKADPSPDVLRLRTIHSFKGRECPIVFVLGPRNGYMPDRRATEPHQVEEERRVAYVAATRAKEKLYFWCSELYEKEMSMRADGLTWDMYRQGLTSPPAKPATRPEQTPAKQAPPKQQPVAVRESQPGLLELALKWLLRKLG